VNRPDVAARRLLAVVLGSGAIAMLASGCGQTPSAHAMMGSSPDQFWAPGGATPDPNGENLAPAPGALTYKYTVTTITRTTQGQGGRFIANPLQQCPVWGQGSFSDDFGAPRYAGGFHLHQGNDIFAARRTPVVAPFDGVAAATPNTLGGNAVTVYAAQGYVYNAHLAGYGKLGRVSVGEVIGYVGNTGDAMGGATHDHFEWHPGNGPAVDPFPFLKAACVG
jgi:murein DD-endopeptidase MepM/ murein hydrolase activator NlpD